MGVINVLTEPNIAISSLPNVSVLATDSSGNIVAGSPTSPASPSGSIQFNDSGAFGGSANATLDSSGNATFLGTLNIQNSTTVGTLANFGDASYFYSFQPEIFVVADNINTTFSNLLHLDAGQSSSRAGIIMSNSSNDLGKNWSANFIQLMVNGENFYGNYYPTALGSYSDAGKQLIIGQSNDGSAKEMLIGTDYYDGPVSLISNSSIVATFNSDHAGTTTFQNGVAFTKNGGLQNGKLFLNTDFGGQMFWDVNLDNYSNIQNTSYYGGRMYFSSYDWFGGTNGAVFGLQLGNSMSSWSYNSTLVANLNGIGVNATPLYAIDVYDVSSTGYDIGNSTTALWKIDNAGNIVATSFKPTSNYESIDGSTGYTGTVTTASLVGKTITIKNGLITDFS